MKPKITVIIPIHNGVPDTLECLKSLYSQSPYRQKIKIIIVDNHSTDNSQTIIKKKYPQTTFITLSQNLGFAPAINQALIQTKSPFVLILNNDIILDKKYLHHLITLLQKRPKAAIAGGKIFYQYPQNTIFFAGIYFNPWTGTTQKRYLPDKAQKTSWIPGCAMLIKQKLIYKIGFFDPFFFYTFEDKDYCTRALKAGFQIYYQPQALAWHKAERTIDKLPIKKKAYELYRSKFYYIFKHSTPAQIASSVAIQFLLIAPFRTIIRTKPYFSTIAMLKAFLYNISHLKKTLSLRHKTTI